MFALPISKPRFKSIIFNQNSPKIKLFLQKNAKFSSAWGLPSNPQPPAAGGFAPRPPKQLPHCEFLATRLDHTMGLFYSFVIGLRPTRAKNSDWVWVKTLFFLFFLLFSWFWAKNRTEFVCNNFLFWSLFFSNFLKFRPPPPPPLFKILRTLLLSTAYHQTLTDKVISVFTTSRYPEVGICPAIIAAQLFHLRWRLHRKYFCNFERTRASASLIRLCMIVFQSNVIKINKKTLSRYIGVVRIFDWGGGGRSNHKSYVMTSTKFFEKRNFLRDKYTVEWRIRSRGLGWHVTWVLLKKKDVNLKLNRFPKLSALGDVVSKLV